MNASEAFQIGGETGLPTINVGISASDLIASVMRQARLAQASGNLRKALQAGLQHLQQRGLIDRQERQSLARMCDLALIASDGGKPAATALERLRRLHDALVTNGSGPASVSIAAAIVQHFAANPPAVRVTRRGRNAFAGLVGAVIIGGVIGGLAGGPGGIVIGVVGGAVGALTDCSRDD